MKQACLRCGRQFEGVGQRRYCTQRCKKRQEKDRERRQRLQVQLWNHEAKATRAEITGNAAQRLHHQRHVERIRAQLDSLPL